MEVVSVDTVGITTVVRTQQGAVRAGDDASPIELTIVDTYYPSGRKDCTVRVPRLSVKASARKGVDHA